MINRIIKNLYNFIPQPLQKKLGNSKILKLIRNLLLRPYGSFRETSVIVKRNYLEYPVSFIFFASLKVSAKAERKGIENTLLRNSLKLLKDKVPSGDAVVLDVGANFGYLSMVWANSVAKNGKVFAFEPNVKVFRSFQKSVAENQLESRIKPNNLAVGKENGRITIYTNTTTANILKAEMTQKNASLIEMVTLNSFVKNADLYRCDLVKIDVDGIELEILKGATDLIEHFRPIFIVETNEDRRIIEYFMSFHYQILDMELNPFQTGAVMPPNIFCIPKLNSCSSPS